MKAGWELLTLGEVCKFVGGSQPPKKDFVYEPGDDLIRLLQIRDYKSDNKSVYIPKVKAKRFCEPDDIMIGRYGPPIFQILRGKAGAYNVALMKAVPNEGLISKDYLFLFLKSPELLKYVINSSSRAAGQSGVNKAGLDPYPIPIPPLEEQKRIVAVLDAAFEGLDHARAHVEANLQNARDLFESSLEEVFNREYSKSDLKIRKLGSLTTVKSGGTPARKTKSYWGEGFDWYSSGELNFRFTESAKEQITLSGLQNSNAKLFRRGALLIGIYDTAAMKMSILDRDATFNQAIVGVEPCEDFSVDYLHLFLEWKKPELLNLRRGTRQKNLSLAKIKDIGVLLPTIEEQAKIAEKLKTVFSQSSDLRSNYQTKLTDLADLRQSLLQKAFAGELT